jgi:flagellar M-ring protein FliF
MEKYFEQLKKFVLRLSLQQQALLAASILAVGLTLWFFVHLFSQPDFKPLYSGLSSSDLQNLEKQLAEKNIQYEISSDGTTLKVPADKLDELRIEVSSKSSFSSGRLGFELFDKPNWSGSDFSEKVNYQRALEAELERTIQTIDGIEAARVHLVLPHESLFTEKERQGKAAVVVKLRGGHLSEDTLNSIARLVSSAVDDLPPENVAIVDAEGGTPIRSRGGAGETAGSMESEKAIADKLIATLAPVVGADHVKASVTVDRDASSGESTQEVYDPNSVVLTSQISEEHVTDASPSGVPGTTSNVPRPAAPGAPSAKVQITTDSQGLRSESKTFVVGRTVRHLIEPSGRVKRIAAALLVDDAVEIKEEAGKKQEVRRKRTPEEMKQIEELAKAAMGFDATRGDQLSVQNLSFQVLPVEKVVPPTVVQRVLWMTERWVVAIRLAGLFLLFGIVYLVLLRPIKKQVLASFRAAAPAHPPAKGIVSNSGGTAPGAAEAGFDLEGELATVNSEVGKAVLLKRHLVEKVKAEPESSSRLIQNWIRQGQNN